MQLINNFEKIIVESPGGEFSSAFRTGRDRSVFATFVYKPVLKQYIIRMLQYVYTYGNFQETSMVLFTICVRIILTPKQFPGLSVSYLQSSTRYLARQKSVLSKSMVAFYFFYLAYSHLQSYCFVCLLLLVP